MHRTVPLAAQRGQDAHRHKVADSRHEAHRADDPHRRHRAGKRLAGHEQDHGPLNTETKEVGVQHLGKVEGPTHSHT